MVDAAQFLRARHHVHELLARHGRVDERVAARGHLAQARADGEQHVRGAHALAQDRVHAHADVAHVVLVAVVEEVLEAEGARDRQVVRLGEAADVRAGVRRPAAAAQHHERPLGARQQVPQALHFAFARIGVGRLVGTGVGDAHHLGEHVLREGEHDGAAAA
jgi:hypothetical protein